MAEGTTKRNPRQEKLREIAKICTTAIKYDNEDTIRYLEARCRREYDLTIDEAYRLAGQEETPVLWCVKDGTTDMLRFLIAEGCSVNDPGYGGVTPLHATCKFGNLDAAEVLLAQGARIDARNNEGATPLYESVKLEHSYIAERLVANGCSVNAKIGMTQTTALHIACFSGYIRFVKLLLKKGGADANAEDVNGRTPMYAIFAQGNRNGLRQPGNKYHCVKKLVKYNVNCTHRDAELALWFAARDNQPEVVEMLIKHGTPATQLHRLHGDTFNPGTTPLSEACRGGSFEACLKLVKLNIDPDAHNDVMRSSALMEAALAGHERFCKALCYGGVDRQHLNSWLPKEKLTMRDAIQFGHGMRAPALPGKLMITVNWLIEHTRKVMSLKELTRDAIRKEMRHDQSTTLEDKLKKLILPPRLDAFILLTEELEQLRQELSD